MRNLYINTLPLNIIFSVFKTYIEYHFLLLKWICMINPKPLFENYFCSLNKLLIIIIISSCFHMIFLNNWIKTHIFINKTSHNSITKLLIICKFEIFMKVYSIKSISLVNGLFFIPLNPTLNCKFFCSWKLIITVRI